MQKEQKQIQRLIWLFLCFVWIFRCYQGLLLYQLQQAPFISVKADNVYWLYHATQIPTLVLQHKYLALSLDLAWLIISILGVFGRQRRWSSILVYLLFVNYMILSNSVSTHHEHILVGLLFCMPLLFVQNKAHFTLLFAGIRYYALFTLLSAGLWKLYRGSLFTPNQMSEILKHQHIDYLISHPGNYFSNFIILS